MSHGELQRTDHRIHTTKKTAGKASGSLGAGQILLNSVDQRMIGEDDPSVMSFTRAEQRF